MGACENGVCGGRLGVMSDDRMSQQIIEEQYIARAKLGRHTTHKTNKEDLPGAVPLQAETADWNGQLDAQNSAVGFGGIPVERRDCVQDAWN